LQTQPAELVPVMEYELLETGLTVLEPFEKVYVPAPVYAIIMFF
jgi:hypothetical protein